MLHTGMLSVLLAPPFSETIISEIRESWDVTITVSVQLPANYQLWHVFGLILIATKWNWLAMKCDASEIESHQETQNWSLLTSGSLCTETTVNIQTDPWITHVKALSSLSSTLTAVYLQSLAPPEWVKYTVSCMTNKQQFFEFFFSFGILQLCLSYDFMHLDILAWNWQQKSPRLHKRMGQLILSIGEGSALQSEICLPTAVGDFLE